ncbi:hypothetical protein HK101_000904, partial [Irineochytrium annulatum]
MPVTPAHSKTSAWCSFESEEPGVIPSVDLTRPSGEPEPEVTVYVFGRNKASCDVILPCRRVADMHLVIYEVHGCLWFRPQLGAPTFTSPLPLQQVTVKDGVEVLRIYVEDASRHGTFVNGKRLARREQLELKDDWTVCMRKRRKRRSSSDRGAAAKTDKKESVGGGAECLEEDDDVVGAVEVTASELARLVGDACVRWVDRTEEEVAASVANRVSRMRDDGVIWDRM